MILVTVLGFGNPRVPHQDDNVDKLCVLSSGPVAESIYMERIAIIAIKRSILCLGEIMGRGRQLSKATDHRHPWSSGFVNLISRTWEVVRWMRIDASPGPPAAVAHSIIGMDLPALTFRSSRLRRFRGHTATIFQDLNM